MSAASIKKYRERLEGSYRLLRIKKIKRGFYAVQIIMALVVASVISFMMGMRFEPFFFPTDVFVFIVLIIGAVMAGEGVYFRGLEMKFTRSKSRRFLIARSSIRNSTVIVIMFIILIIALLMPMTDEYLSSGFEELPDNQARSVPFNVEDADSNNNTFNFDFVSHHPMGLVKLNNMIVWINGTSDYEITVRNVDGGALISRPLFNDRENTYGLEELINSRMDLSAEVENNGPLPVNGSYTYYLDFGMSSFFTLLIPLILIVIVVIQLVSISIMLPLREFYASSSIYSKSYVPEKEEGAEHMSERLAAKAKKEKAILEETIDIKALEASLPPPPPPPPPPTKAEPVTKMGDLEADLEEEPDLACAKCGEMNSPHAAMCFVCGNPMVSTDKVIDIEDIMTKGEHAMLGKKYGEAVRFFDEVIRNDSSNQKALLGKGKALNAQGKWGMAVQYVNTIINMNPSNIEALLLKGQILEARGQVEMALEIYDKVMVIDPSVKIAAAKKDELTHEMEDMVVAA
ncbi:MAG: hypothetical protein KAS67_05085, partial [Thermoplasmata archaeon]|nr:hypothetical protein [Thermoplasmata archaeon]